MAAFSTRDDALDHFEDACAYVHQARLIAMKIASERGSVTTDDVWNALPPPSRLDPRVMGAVLRRPTFIKVGSRETTRRIAHKRPIGVFQLAEVADAAH